MGKLTTSIDKIDAENASDREEYLPAIGLVPVAVLPAPPAAPSSLYRDERNQMHTVEHQTIYQGGWRSPRQSACQQQVDRQDPQTIACAI